MSAYRLPIKPGAAKAIEHLASPIIARVVKQFQALSEAPRPPGSKKLKGGDHEWRLRFGDYRIIFKIDDTKSSSKSREYDIEAASMMERCRSGDIGAWGKSVRIGV